MAANSARIAGGYPDEGARQARFGGLRLRPSHPWLAAKAVVACVAAVTISVVVLDALIFRHALPIGYENHFTSPLVPRILAMSLSAALDEVKFRLLAMTGLVVLFTAGRRKLSPTSAVAAIVLAQLIAVWPAVLEYPLYATLRFWVVGSVWGWLYWRHGWYAALIGHSAIHLALDPLLKVALLNT